MCHLRMRRRGKRRRCNFVHVSREEGEGGGKNYEYGVDREKESAPISHNIAEVKKGGKKKESVHEGGKIV